MKVANRVIFNTGILYIQLIIGLAIGLFTTRIVLKALGETDYGIYMLVAGIVGMLGILNSNMSNTSMRYMAHSLGSGDRETTLKTFNTTLFLHIVIGGIVVLFMAFVGWIMFEYLLNIPKEKIFDAKVVFIFMIITTLVTVISVPYDAVMNAHENILTLSLIDTLGNVLKLGAAIYLTYSKANLLILYGLLMLIVQVLLRIIKQWYSKIKYDECKIRFRQYVDKALLKSILSFTGWNLFGSLGSMAVTQVRSLVLNMFFGVKLNAAEGISRNASSAVNMVSTNMTRALNPQLMKSEGSGNRDRLIYITQVGTRFSLFLFALFAIPVFFETTYLLNLWLKEVPDFAIIFCRLSLVAMLIEKFSFQITDTLRAIGNIKAFQVTETSILLLNIPFAYFAFNYGYPPVSIYVIGIASSILLFFVRLYYGNKIAGMNISSFINKSILPVVIPIILATILSSVFHFYMTESFWRLCTVSFIFFISFTISFWVWGLQLEEKSRFKNILFQSLEKLRLIIWN